MLRNRLFLTALAAGILAVPAVSADAPGYFKVPGTETSMQIYGYAVLDTVYTAVQPAGGNAVNNGLSSVYQGFGTNGFAAPVADDSLPKNQFDMTANDSRVGIRTVTPSDMGDIKTRFEGDFNYNNHTSNSGGGFHLRQMYGEVNGWLLGKTDSNFEDPDGSPDYIDQDGLLADWYGTSRFAMIKYTSHLNPQTDLMFSVEKDVMTINNMPTGATVNQDLPGAVTGRLQYADKWGHVSGAFAYQRYSMTTNPANAATPVAASTFKTTKDSLSWAIAGHFQFGEDSLVYHFGQGSGQYGAGLEDAGIIGKDGQLDMIQANQLELGYTHAWTSKVASNLFGSYVGYKRDDNKYMTGAALKSYIQAGANTKVQLNKTCSWALEYEYGVAKTFDADEVLNPNGSTTDAVHQSALHFQFKVKFF